jgi:hypothetical protein
MTKRLSYLSALLALYIVLVAFANHRHLWHDELYTFYIAQAPSLTELWKDLHLDLNPPLLYLLSRASMSVFGNTAFAVRFPSMVALCVASLCLFELLRHRLQSPSFAALAVLVFWSSPAFYFANEARPYALVLGFFALAMLAMMSERPRPLILALPVSGMMLSHFFAILFLSPFLIAEVVQSFRNRRINWPVIAALVLPCIIPFFFLSFHGGETFPPAFRASIRKMAGYYYWTLRDQGLLWIVGFCAAAVICYWATHSKIERPRYSPRELSFTLALLALPILMNGVLMLMHGAFFTRYSAPTLLAFPILFVALLSPWTNNNRVAALSLTVALAVYCVWHESTPIPKHSDFSRIHPDLPLVAASGLTFLEMDHEEPQSTVDRLYYLTDRDKALTYAHATLFEGLPVIKQHLPIRGHVEPFDTFVRDHHQFLVLGTPEYAEDWLLRYLIAHHANLQLLGEFPSEYKDSKLFLVSF